jgi:4,5:9,10-diseco-3-hydroxy-5,9,17-trioxoandrosta-1(10),2-diene-4-oate hydrolase
MEISQCWIEAGGERLFVRRWGRGVPILCLHAIGHDSLDFEGLAQAVGGEFEIVALDWPGQGQSPRGTGPVTAQHYAAVATQAMVALGLGRPVVLGNSIGGTAAILMGAAGAAVRGLVLCDPGGLTAIDGTARTAIGALTALFRAGARGPGWYRWAFELYYRQVLPRAPKRRAEIVAAAYDIAPVLAEAWAGFSQPASDLRALAPKVAAPVLLAWSKGDRIIAWSRCKAAALTFPRHELRFYRGGHSAFLEDLDAFAADLRAAVRAWK